MGRQKRTAWGGDRGAISCGSDAYFDFFAFFGLLIVFGDSAYKETIGGVKYITAKFKEV